jgi:hypothetical protein
MRADTPKAGVPKAETPTKATRKRAKPPDDITTMRVRRTTLAKLAQRQKELGAASLDEALETILFRQRSYEAIARLKANPGELTDYQHHAQEWAEIDVEAPEHG